MSRRAEWQRSTAWRINETRVDPDIKTVSAQYATEGTSMMRLLEQRVPVTLILDLVAPPDPLELYLMEGSDLDWTDPQPPAARD